VAPADALPTAPPEASSEATPVVEDLESIAELWPAVIELVLAGHALCGAVIADTRPLSLAGEDLTVGFPTSAAFLKKKAEDPSNRQIVTDALRRLAGGRWRIGYELSEDLDAGSGDGPSRTYTEEEWIERFKSELDAEEIPVEHEPGEPAAAGGERQEA
jgi:DNA polymerase-3 subunit gamma/tau